MIRKFLLPVLSVALLLWAVGCSENSASSDPAPATSDLNEDFGGYVVSAESPAFGDTDLMATEGDEEVIDDAMAYSPSVQAIESDPTAGIFRFRAVWGHLNLDTTETDLTDWTGSLTISRGAILIRRAIRFELGQDYIVPRTERTLLEWVSQTTVHNDGIDVDLLVPRLLPVIDTTIDYVVDSLGDTSEVVVIDTIQPDPEPVTVTFETGPYSRTFSLGELTGLDEVVDLTDGNQVAFTAFQYSRCPKGALAGLWGRDEEGNGVFRGRVLSQTGDVIGWIAGIYGVNDQGSRVLFGKWIAHNGAFEGLIAGTYKPHANENASETGQNRSGGKFEADIFNGNFMKIGELKGNYKGATRFNGGYFQGRWRLDCPNDDSEPDTGNAQGIS
ncbi:hypothetical protein KQH82_12860 [bacterium]|nr:hypothetical protein [bacterium]